MDNYKNRIIGFIIIILALLLLYIMLHIGIRRMNNYYAQKNLEYQEMKLDADNISELEKNMELTNIKLNILQRLKTKEQVPLQYVDILRKITLILPKNMYLRNLTIDYNKKFILANGTSIEKNSIPQFIKALKDMEIIDLIKTDNISRRIYKNMNKIGYDFKLYLKLL